MSEKINLKNLSKEKLKLAIENFQQAEIEGAESLTPVTYHWAKEKIYHNKKLILRYPLDQKRVDNATNEACAAAATLLSAVRYNSQRREKFLEEEINNLINEGGPSL